MSSIEIKNRIKITDQKWLNLFEVSYEAKGKEGKWIYASRKENPTNELSADAIIIAPIIKIKNEYKLVLIKEFRIPLGKYEIGFPAGLAEKKETAENCAERELFEETGLKITSIFSVSPLLISSAGLSDEAVVMVFCECEGTVSSDYLETTEDIEVLLIGQNDIDDLLASSCCFSAKAWPFIQMFKILGKMI